MKKLLVLALVVSLLLAGCSSKEEPSSSVPEAQSASSSSQVTPESNADDNAKVVPALDENLPYREYVAYAKSLSDSLSDIAVDYVEKGIVTGAEMAQLVRDTGDAYLGNISVGLTATSLPEEDMKKVQRALEEFVDWRTEELISLVDIAREIYEAGQNNELIKVLQLTGDVISTAMEMEIRQDSIQDIQRTYAQYLPDSSYLTDIVSAGSESFDLSQFQ